MPNQNTDFQVAQETAQRIYNHAFKTRLASANIHPTNDAEFASMLEMGQKLAAAEQHKQANSVTPYLESLNQALNANGFGNIAKEAQDQEETLMLKAAAQEAMKDPMIYNSIVHLKQAQALVASQQILAN